METQTLPQPQINGHQNQVNYQQINNFSVPTYSINGRPASEEDTRDFLLGRAESAERELEAHKATIDALNLIIQTKDEQTYLQQEIIKQLRQEVSRMQDNLDRLMECNNALNQLVAAGIRRRA